MGRKQVEDWENDGRKERAMESGPERESKVERQKERVMEWEAEQKKEVTDMEGRESEKEGENAEKSRGRGTETKLGGMGYLLPLVPCGSLLDNDLIYKIIVK